ncbi:MAG: right-handed parallel beta-helix repeat-containing protein [Kiritimatiellia bacterium]
MNSICLVSLVVGAVVASLPAYAASAASSIKPPIPAGARIIEVDGSAACASLEAALDQVAEIRRTDTATPLAVRIAAGDYSPVRPLAITRRHAATNWAPLVVCAADFARRPRLHGGQAVTGWRRGAFNGRADVWCADVAALDLPPRPRLLFFNGRRMQPARWPNLDPKRPYTSGYAFADARGFPQKGARFSPTGLYEDEIQIRPGDERTWAHPEDAWTIVYPRHNWWNRALDVVGASNGVVRVKARHVELTDRLFPWDRWCVENMAEELDAPGEWYYDARARKVHLLPPDGSDPNRAVVTLAKDGPILAITGGNCTVAGLELTGGGAGVRIDHADRVDLLGCVIHDIGFHGGTGVWIMGHHVRMADCDVFNIGGNGVFVQEYPGERRVDDRLDVVVENNYLHHCGEINSHGIGIWITGQGVRVSHNLVHDMPRCGLFGYGRFCEISYNRVRHVNTINDDTGAIYGGGWIGGIGSKVCYNWISDSIGFQRQADGAYRLHKGACGIYPDEGCGGLAVYGNLVEHCHHVAMHLHNGRWITISNNVFVSNGALPTGRHSAQLSLQTWDANPKGYFVHDRRAAISNEYHALVDADPRWRRFPALAQAPDDDSAFADDGTTMMGVQVRNNVVAYPDQGEGMMLRAWRLNTATNTFDCNVYWPGQTTNVVMNAGQKGGSGWGAWRATGADARSVIADPLFRDAARGDYRLRPESPAFRLGFVELPYEKMGLQRTCYRPELPPEAEGVREHPEWLSN